MRIVLFFDLPTKTAKNKRDYIRFRKYLLNEGFEMMQWSVYTRICNNHESMEKRMNLVQKNLPPKGSVRALPVTEKQYTNMRLMLGEKTSNEEHLKINQMTLF
ncbi:CRISPR-associated endonuclease Cas2 [Halalkalibacter okhensis]|uniref:CRISPR-associated endoribonuclease Cas2 n=1 Tax=Halalkalibacter okhensis TaxID=333138 RepID=A0A0B0ID48_9BACI|nr:CRISPR-associated endonuclease Cas2 [Halalkalibacter okhensis]KHF37964.1 CRISPR-associated protein Cas2 [Halalkalibacter okhensis]